MTGRIMMNLETHFYYLMENHPAFIVVPPPRPPLTDYLSLRN